MGRYSLQGQLKRGLVVGTLIAACTAAVLVAIYLVTRARGLHFSDLTRDAAATLEGPWYTAALSNATVVMTSAGAAIAIFSASLLDGPWRGSIKGFLITLGLLVGVIAADDLFMLHETVLPALGIRASVLFAVYALTLLGILWIWREAILGGTDYVFLVLAGLALGISAVVDSIFTDEGLLELPFSGELIEDPAKILGMVFMTFYLVVTARQVLLRRADSTTT